MSHDWQENSCARCGITRGRIGRYYANNGDMLACGEYPGFPIGEADCGHPLAARRLTVSGVDCWACLMPRLILQEEQLDPIRVGVPAPAPAAPAPKLRPVQRPVQLGSTRLTPGYERRVRRQGNRCIVFDVPSQEAGA